MKSIKEFNTTGMKIWEREELFKKVEPIQIGEKVYENEGFAGGVAIITVDHTNQKHITMFWNSMYFDSYEKAEQSNNESRAGYFQWQSECLRL